MTAGAGDGSIGDDNPGAISAGDAPNSLVERLARGGAIGLVGRFANKGLGLALQVVLTRVLGPTPYGRYVLGLSVTRVVQRLGQLGLDQGAIRFGAEHSDDERTLAAYLLAAIGTSALSGVALAAVLLLAADTIARRGFGDPGMAGVLRLFALAVPFYVLLNLVGAALQALERIDAQQQVTSGIRPIANIALVAGAFAAGYRLDGAVAAFVVTGAVSTVVGAVLLVRAGALGPVLRSRDALVRSLREAVDVLPGLLRYALPMLFVAATFDLSMRTDRLLLGVYRSAEAVGLYNVAAMVALQFGVVISSLIAIFKPIAASLATGGESARLRPVYAAVTKWASYGTLALFVVTALFASEVLSVFGPAFTAAEPVLYVLPLVYVAGALFGPCGALLTMTDRLRIEVANGALLLGLNLALDVLLIPRFGGVGAAAAVVVAGVVTNVAQVVAVRVVHGFHPFGRPHRRFVAVAALVVVTVLGWGVGLPLGLRALLAVALVGALVALFTRQIDPAERELLAQVVER